MRTFLATLVLAQRIEPVPDRPGEAYYGLGGNKDNVHPIGYAVMVNGLLWRMKNVDIEVDRCRAGAIAALRYLTASHVTGHATCLNGQKWSDDWQSAMWARAAGVGAWALGDELDRDLQLAAARMIEHEADRFDTRNHTGRFPTPAHSQGTHAPPQKRIVMNLRFRP